MAIAQPTGMKTFKTFPCFMAAACSLISVSALAVEAPKNVISMEQARKSALQKYPGKITDGELEHEAGKWVYSFDITQADRKTHEVWVDAKTGKVIKHEIESAGEEAKERSVENEK